MKNDSRGVTRIEQRIPELQSTLHFLRLHAYTEERAAWISRRVTLSVRPVTWMTSSPAPVRTTTPLTPGTVWALSSQTTVTAPLGTYQFGAASP